MKLILVITKSICAINQLGKSTIQVWYQMIFAPSTWEEKPEWHRMTQNAAWWHEERDVEISGYLDNQPSDSNTSTSIRSLERQEQAILTEPIHFQLGGFDKSSVKKRG
jgi:hypothetical protein